jgi:hypothetical protein
LTDDEGPGDRSSEVGITESDAPAERTQVERQPKKIPEIIILDGRPAPSNFHEWQEHK